MWRRKCLRKFLENIWEIETYARFITDIIILIIVIIIDFITLTWKVLYIITGETIKNC